MESGGGTTTSSSPSSSGAQKAYVRMASDGEENAAASSSSLKSKKKSTVGASKTILMMLTMLVVLGVLQEGYLIDSDDVPVIEDSTIVKVRFDKITTRDMDKETDDEPSYPSELLGLGESKSGDEDGEEAKSGAGFGFGPVAGPEFSLLPRTSSRPYNVLDPDTQYLLYTPSGGFNNQLVCLIDAIFLAKSFNRTLIVPLKGRHSSLFRNYVRLSTKQAIPMDHALDFDYIEEKTGVPLLPLNISLRDYHKQYLKNQKTTDDFLHFIDIPQSRDFHHASIVRMQKMFKLGQESKSKVVFYYGAFYNRHWVKTWVKKSIRYSPYVLSFAKAITDSLFDGTIDFQAFHVRMGDKMALARKLSGNSRHYVTASKTLGFSKNVPVYISTDAEKDSRYLRPLRNRFDKVFFAIDLKKKEELRQWFEDYFRMVPASQIRIDLFGLIEQMVCVRAKKFIGTSVSSFTRTIDFLRDNLQVSEPEIAKLNQTGRTTASIIYNGKITHRRKDTNL